MGAVYFYHLTRSPTEATLATLLDRALAQGWRVAVRACDAARLEWLDQKLWMGPEEGFLPHGIAGGPRDGMQPVLLTIGQADGCDCLMAIDGAEVTAEEAARAERTCILFDGNDAGALEGARGQWRTLAGAGITAVYWSEESGRWQKMAETGTA